MAPIKTIKVACATTIGYLFWSAYNSDAVVRRWFSESLTESGIIKELMFHPLKTSVKVAVTRSPIGMTKYNKTHLAVSELSSTLVKLGSHDWICDDKFNAKAIRLLELYENTDEPEILWRLARACVERSLYQTVEGRKISQEEKSYFIKKAFELGQKALLKEPKPGIAGAHKWYAVTLDTLLKHHKPSSFSISDARKFSNLLAPSDGNVKAEIIAHLEKAAEIDPNDKYTWKILGDQYNGNKEFEKATKCFEKAESIKETS